MPRSAAVVPFPARGEVFLDARGDARALRVTWHPDDGVVVLSLWGLDSCRATIRLPVEEVPRLIRMLVAGLGDVASGRSG